MFFRELAKYTAKAICKKLTPAGRAIVVRDSIPTEDLTNNLPLEQLRDLLFSISRRLRIPSITIRGQYGDIEGSPHDEVILRSYATTGTWSPRFQSEVIDRSFRNSGGSFIDVGANIGLTAIPAVKNHPILCIALEPDPTNFTFLQRNIQINNLAERIKPINLAAYDKRAVLDFELSPNNLGDHRIRPNDCKSLVTPQQHEERRAVIKVNAMPIDEILENETLQHPIVVKIDTQGSEPVVFRGASRLLKKADCLVVEFSPYTLARSGFDEGIFFEHLQDFKYGYVIALDKNYIGEPPATYSEPLGMAEIFEICKTAAQNKHPDNYFDIILFKERNFLLVNDVIS